ncbi:MAG: TetR/AcrR family transcriptional regulator [Alkalispirochaeta sp.]
MSDVTRERIIEGVLDLIRSRAVSDFSMEALAEWIGVSRKTIYNHFPGKAELLAQAVATGMNRVIEELRTIARTRSIGFVDKLDRIVEEGFRETSRLWNPTTWAVGPRPPMEVRKTVDELDEHIRELIAEIVTEASANGLLSETVQPDILTQVIVNMINGIRSTGDTDAVPYQPLVVLRESLRVCMVGVLSHKGAETLRGSRILNAEGEPV